jgi:hypothetical protein
VPPTPFTSSLPCPFSPLWPEPLTLRAQAKGRIVSAPGDARVGIELVLGPRIKLGAKLVLRRGACHSEGTCSLHLASALQHLLPASCVDLESALAEVW